MYTKLLIKKNQTNDGGTQTKIHLRNALHDGYTLTLKSYYIYIYIYNFFPKNMKH